ncbi:MAG: YicC/YloC family endoribonuclease [Candidatus Sumerlaeia bacterium]
MGNREINLRSMTGFSRVRTETALGQFTVELRSVNNRFHDASVSLPRELAGLEMKVRGLLKGRIARGKIDCRVRCLFAEQARPEVQLNLPLAHSYIERLNELRHAVAASEVPLELVAGLPGVLEVVPAEIDENTQWAALLDALDEAFAAFDRDRAREGGALGQQLSDLGNQLRERLAGIALRKDEVVTLYRERLGQRLAELEEQIKTRLEPGRLEMEVALYADRADISEEIVRMLAHLDRYDDLLAGGGDDSAGRALDFLLQEMGREVNTIMSKSRDTTLTGLGLEMKSILEKIREQIQNIQ